MQPFYGQVQLGTPAVTNGGGETGLQYLSNFVGNCTSCSFNFINVHYYLYRSDVNTTQFTSALKDYIENKVPAVQAQHKALQGLPIFIGEVRLILFRSAGEGLCVLLTVSDHSGGSGTLPKTKAVF